MATFNFPVISNLPPAPSSSSDPILTPRDDLSTCIPRFKTKQEFLDLWDRLLPFEYIEPMKSPGPGYELYEAMAKMFERLSLATGRVECSLFITLAHGAFKSTGQVEFFRENSLNGAFTIKAGTAVRATASNREFILTQDVDFGATDLLKLANVEGKQGDWQFDLPGQVTTATGEQLPGEIDEVSLPILDPSFAEPTIQVRQATATDRGQPATLDLHGKDRSVPRIFGETDDQYRNRVQTLPDTVSPNALIRQLNAVFFPVGISFEFFEVFENRFQSCWNAPASAAPNPTVGNFQPNLFVYNDPRLGEFNNRWLGEQHTGASIVIVVPETFFATFGLAYDDDAATATPTNRGIPAYDASGAGAYDGEDLAAQAFFLRLADLLQKIKPSGCTVVLELEGQ